MNQAATSYIKICQDIGTSPIPEVLSCLSAGIKSCIISSPNEALQDGQVIALCAVLPLAAIEELCFHNLHLNINSWVAIADSCSKCKSLQKLIVKECVFTEGQQGMHSFAKAIGSCELHTIEVTSCLLGDQFSFTLSESRLLKCDRLDTLRLIQCGLTCEGVTRMAKAFESVGMMSNLKTLDLSHNRVSDKGACSLAAMLISEGASSSVPLQCLELEGNQITDVGGLALCKAAKGALVLSRLNLSLNSLTDGSLLAMADALRFNTGTIKEVALAGCQAKEESAVSVIKAATKNNSLHILDIRGVPLGPEGVTQLCQMLRYTATLNTLRVDVASRECAEMVARELPNNRSLMHLTLGGPVPEQLLAMMSEILAANTMRAVSVSPARTSPHIHAWIETATLSAGRPKQLNTSNQQTASAVHASKLMLGAPSSPGSPGPPIASRSRSASPGPGHRGPRSEAGGSVYSHNTYNTANTQRTAATYLSFQYSQMSRKTAVSTSVGAMKINNSMAAGGAAEKAAVIFRKHDLNQDNYLSRDEMLAALQEVGVLTGIRARHVGRFLESEFKKADYDGDGKISLQDFIAWYEKIAHYQTQASREGRIKSATYKHQIPVGAENNPALKRVFRNYCKYALGQGRQYAQDSVPHINMQQFSRLCADAGFIEPEGRLSTTAVEVVFIRYRPTTSRRLGFKEFVEALAAVAYEAGMQFEDVMVVLGCRSGQLLTPDAASQRGSEVSMGGARVGPTSGDAVEGQPFLAAGVNESATAGRAVTGAVLESIQELPPSNLQLQDIGGLKQKGGQNVGAKKVIKKKKRESDIGDSGSVSNPLYESMEGMLRKLSEEAGGGRSAADVKAMEMKLESFEQKLAAVEHLNKVNDFMRTQDINSRMLKIESSVQHAQSKQQELDQVAQQIESLQEVLKTLAVEIAHVKAGSSGGSTRDDGSKLSTTGTSEALNNIEELTHTATQALLQVQVLTGRVDDLQMAITTLQAQQRTTASMGGVGLDMSASEKKLLERQTRFEGALMQVARQVDVLEGRQREDQEASLRTLEAILSQAGIQPNSGATAAVNKLLPANA
ncbi:hypothetical protein CEUSTIGMA_g11435.t1 [Chlamydomonas eustigma]|uniref:EF-hand domain-containing protein n=1 Tax=Chlamydomonas eustigma TaxID=1157962 RepID=A0A250XMJ5_9CHLO|nr:hypothetical protein CEUSTIGMA_g11435.t1 [Chlamydomonas eustigma]|eukprot:GAX84010.1 hypothetical protein CEUSTIGMA_g11435.t1 [Chlamydomonas eustigma]